MSLRTKSCISNVNDDAVAAVDLCCTGVPPTQLFYILLLRYSLITICCNAINYDTIALRELTASLFNLVGGIENINEINYQQKVARSKVRMKAVLKKETSFFGENDL